MKRITLIGAGLSLLTFSCSSLLGDFSPGPGDGGPAQSGSGVGDAASGASSGSSGGDAASGSSGSSGATGSSGSTTPGDASTLGDATAGGKDGGGTAIALAAADVTIYINQKATLVATESTTPAGGTVTSSWSVTSIPTGSAVTTASLTGANTPSVSFVPDVAGNYTVTLNATSDNATATKAVTAHAIAPTAFYMRGDLLPDGGFTSAYYAAAADGTQAHAITCPVTGSTTSSGLFSVAPQTDQFWPPDDFTDYWEAPAGQPSRFAVSIYNSDTLGPPQIFSGIEDASCAEPPTLIFYDGGSTQPRFNPTGSRLVFLGDYSDDVFNIVTVNSDGSQERVVANFATGLADGGNTYDLNNSGISFPPRPQWSGSQVAWVRQYRASPEAWEIVKANDVAGAIPQRYMACAGGTPREFQFLADGSVLVAYRTTSSTGPENLYRLVPDGSQNCAILQQYTDLGNSQLSQATDFALSPDETQVAFLQFDGVADDASFATVPGGFPYVVAVDGGAPSRLSSEHFLYGFRWLGDGTRLLGTRIDNFTDGGFVELATTIVVRTPTPGMAPTVLIHADGYNTFATTGSNGGCTAAGGTTPPAAAWGAFIGAAFACLLRRGRRKEV